MLNGLLVYRLSVDHDSGPSEYNHKTNKMHDEISGRPYVVYRQTKQRTSQQEYKNPGNHLQILSPLL